MKTTTVLVCAALGFSTINVFAQSNVYSSNIVGYATVTLPPGYSLLANPLSAGLTNGGNEIGLEIPGEIILTWLGSNFKYTQFDPTLGIGTGWLDASLHPTPPPVLPPGVGFFFFNPLNTPTNFTFIGQVVPGPASTNYLAIAPGYSLLGSPLPANVSDIILAPVSLPRIDGMVVLSWDNAQRTPLYSFSIFDSTLGWYDYSFHVTSPPSYAIGQGFFFYNPFGFPVVWVQSLP